MPLGAVLTLAVVVVLAGSCLDGRANRFWARPAVARKPATVTPAAGRPAAVTPSSAAKSPTVAPPPGRPLRVALYGDSIAWEARKPFQAMLSRAGVQVGLHAFPASALCDWLPAMRADADRRAVDAVVLVFTGAWFTPCVTDPADGRPLTGTALLEKYLTDLRAAVAVSLRAGVHVFLGLEPLPHRPMRLDPSALRAGFEQIAATTPNATLIAANRAVEGPDGQYVRTLPCAPFEPCDGRDAAGRPAVVVRGPDGIHFCPVLHSGWDCPVWSSGALRFAAALAEGVLHAYGLRS